MKKLEFLPPDAIVQNEAEAQKKVLDGIKLKLTFKPYLITFSNNNNDDTSVAFCWRSLLADKKSEITIFAFEDDLNLMKDFDNYEYIPLSQESTFIIEDRIFTIKHSHKGYELMELPYVYSEQQAKSIARVINADSNLVWDICLAHCENEPLCYVWYGKSNIDESKSFYIPVFPEDVDKINYLDYLGFINKNKPIINEKMIYEFVYDKTAGLVIKRLCPMLNDGPHS